MLGNVHVAHDLDTGDDRALGVPGHGKDLPQHAVDPHPHRHSCLPGLQMDIGGILVDSVFQEAVDQTDGGGCIFAVGANNVGGGDILEVGGGLVLGLLQILQRLLGRLGTVQIRDGTGQGIGGGQHGHHLALGRHPHRVGSHEVQRVLHGDVQCIGIPPDGNHIVLPGQRAGQHLGQFLGDNHAAQIHELNIQLLFQDLIHFALTDIALLHQNIHQFLAGGLLLDLQCLVQLLSCNMSGGDHHLTDALINHFRTLPIIRTLLSILVGSFYYSRQ